MSNANRPPFTNGATANRNLRIANTNGAKPGNGPKVDPSDPQVRKLVYNMYRGLLDKKHEKANVILDSAPQENVATDEGVGARVQSMMRQQTELKGGNMNAGGPPPPPPPPPIPGIIPSSRLPTESSGGFPVMDHPPAALASAMMKERKPFTYTPGGLDLSEIRSPRMQRRLFRNAQSEGVKPSPLAQQPSQSAANASGVSHSAAQGRGIQVLPMPGMGMGPQQPQPQPQKEPPKPKRTVCGPAPPPPPFAVSDNSFTMPLSPSSNISSPPADFSSDISSPPVFTPTLEPQLAQEPGPTIPAAPPLPPIGSPARRYSLISASPPTSPLVNATLNGPSPPLPPLPPPQTVRVPITQPVMKESLQKGGIISPPISREEVKPISQSPTPPTSTDQDLSPVEKESLSLESSKSPLTPEFITERVVDLMSPVAAPFKDHSKRRASLIESFPVQTSVEASSPLQISSPLETPDEELSPKPIPVKTLSPVDVKESSPVQFPVEQHSPISEASMSDLSPVQQLSFNEVSPIEEPLVKELSPLQQSPDETPSPVQQFPITEPSPVSPVQQKEDYSSQPSIIKEVTPIRQIPIKELSPIRQGLIEKSSPVSPTQHVPVQKAFITQQPILKDPSPVQKAPVKEPSPIYQVPIKEMSQLKQSPVKEPPPVQLAPLKEPPLLQQAPFKVPSTVHQGPIKEPSPMQQAPLKESSPIRQAPLKEPSPIRQAPIKEPSPIRQAPLKEPSPIRQAPVKEPSPIRQAPLKEPSPIRQAPLKEPSPVRQALVKEPSLIRPIPIKEPSPFSQAPTTKESFSFQCTPIKEPSPVRHFLAKEPSPFRRVSFSEPSPIKNTLVEPSPIQMPTESEAERMFSPIPVKEMPIKEPTPVRQVLVREPTPVRQATLQQPQSVIEPPAPAPVTKSVIHPPAQKSIPIRQASVPGPSVIEPNKLMKQNSMPEPSQITPVPVQQSSVARQAPSQLPVSLNQVPTHQPPSVRPKISQEPQNVRPAPAKPSNEPVIRQIPIRMPSPPPGSVASSNSIGQKSPQKIVRQTSLPTKPSSPQVSPPNVHQESINVSQMENNEEVNTSPTSLAERRNQRVSPTTGLHKAPLPWMCGGQRTSSPPPEFLVHAQQTQSRIQNRFIRQHSVGPESTSHRLAQATDIPQPNAHTYPGFQRQKSLPPPQRDHKPEPVRIQPQQQQHQQQQNVQRQQQRQQQQQQQQKQQQQQQQPQPRIIPIQIQQPHQPKHRPRERIIPIMIERDSPPKDVPSSNPTTSSSGATSRTTGERIIPIRIDDAAGINTIPRFQQPKSFNPNPQPHIQQPQSQVQAPQPHIQQPQPQVIQPQPYVLQPQPHIQQPQPHLQHPQPHVLQTQPNLQQPQSHMQHPQPHVQQPQPQMQQPQPQIQSSKPQMQEQHHQQQGTWNFPGTSFTPPSPTVSSASFSGQPNGAFVPYSSAAGGVPSHNNALDALHQMQQSLAQLNSGLQNAFPRFIQKRMSDTMTSRTTPSTQNPPQENGAPTDSAAHSGEFSPPIQSRSFRVLQSVLDQQDTADGPSSGAPMKIEVPHGAPAHVSQHSTVQRGSSHPIGSMKRGSLSSASDEYVVGPRRSFSQQSDGKRGSVSSVSSTGSLPSSGHRGSITQLNGGFRIIPIYQTGDSSKIISQQNGGGSKSLVTDPKTLSNIFKDQVHVSTDTEEARSRGGHIFTKGTNNPQKTDPQGPVHIPNIRQQQKPQYQPNYQQQPGHYQPPSYKQQPGGVNTAASTEDATPEPKKYMGGNIPSRSFRMLQAMTANDDDVSDAGDHTTVSEASSKPDGDKPHAGSQIPSPTSKGTTQNSPSSLSPSTLTGTNDTSSDSGISSSSKISPSYTTTKDSRVYRQVSPKIVINGSKNEHVVNSALSNTSSQSSNCSSPTWKTPTFSQSPQSFSSVTPQSGSKLPEDNNESDRESPRLMKIIRQESSSPQNHIVEKRYEGGHIPSRVFRHLMAEFPASGSGENSESLEVKSRTNSKSPSPRHEGGPIPVRVIRSFQNEPNTSFDSDTTDASRASSSFAELDEYYHNGIANTAATKENVLKELTSQFDQTGIRKKPKAAPGKVFRYLQAQYDDKDDVDSQQQQSSHSLQPDSDQQQSFGYRGSKVPSPSFRFLQSQYHQKPEEVPVSEEPPVPDAPQHVDEPTPYSGGRLPGRTFRYLQENITTHPSVLKPRK